MVRAVGDQGVEATILNYIGKIYINLRQYANASKFLEQASIISKQVVDSKLSFNTILPSSMIVPRGFPLSRRRANGYSRGGRSDTLSRKPLKPFGVYSEDFIGITLPAESSDNNFKFDINTQSTDDNLPSNSLIQNEQPVKSIIDKNEIKQLSGISSNNLGIAYLHQGEYYQAEESINQALTIFSQIDDKTGQGNALNNLGELYRHRSQYPQALKYLNRALGIFKDDKNRLGIGTVFNNIGLVHNELGEDLQALQYYQKSLKIRKKIEDRYGVGTTFHNIGFIYNKLKKYDKALEFYQQALQVRHNFDDRGG